MMTEKYYEIGGSTVRVCAPLGVLDVDNGQLAPFEISAAQPDREVHIAFVQTLTPPTGTEVFRSPERQVYCDGPAFLTYVGSDDNSAYMRIHREGSCSTVEAKRTAFPHLVQSRGVLTAMEVEHIVAQNQGILLHASFIEYEGQGILFTAPSGTGKSTQAELWRCLRGAQVLNGDRAIACRVGERFAASGVPFSGSSGICFNKTVPLQAIVYLSQAPATCICSLRGIRAFRAIWEGCSLHTWNRDDVEACTRTLTDLVQEIPVYHLSCTPDESAVRALETELRKQRI